MPGTGLVTAKLDGESIQLELADCRACLGGAFAGRVELDVECDASAVDPIVDETSLHHPVSGEPLPVSVVGERKGGLSLVFCVDRFEKLDALPARLRFSIGDRSDVECPVVLADSVPIEERHSLRSPGEIVRGDPTRGSSIGVISKPHSKVWNAIAIVGVLLGVGVGVSGATEGGGRDPVWLPFALGALVASFGAAAWLLGLLLRAAPVWFDPAGRRVMVAGSGVFANGRRLASAARRSVDEFHHVRVWHQERGNESSEVAPEQGEWRVMLEGSVPFAGHDGQVHVRNDAVSLGGFGSERDALQWAARTGHRLDLPILMTD